MSVSGSWLHCSGWEAPRPSGLSSWIVNHRPWLGQRMSRGRSPWRCLTMPMKYTSGPAYLKSESARVSNGKGLRGRC